VKVLAKASTLMLTPDHLFSPVICPDVWHLIWFL